MASTATQIKKIKAPKVVAPPKGVVRPATPPPPKGIPRAGSTVLPPPKGVVRPGSTTAAGTVMPGSAAATAAAGTPPPPPPDPLRDKAYGAADKTWEVTTGGLKTNRDLQLKAYGYNEDPTSKALSFDPNNPFSKASLLKQEYDISRRKTGQQMGSSGQLYAGSFQNAQDYLNRGQLQAEDTLQKNLNAWLAQNTTDVATAGTTRQSAYSDADSDSRTRSDASYKPADTTPAATATATPAATKATPAQVKTATKTATDKAKAAADAQRKANEAKAAAAKKKKKK